MTWLYRLLRKPFSMRPFDGEGSYRYGGRWSRPGTRIVYTAENLSLAILEYLVHLDPDHPPTDLVLAQAVVPDQLSRIDRDEASLPEDWQRSPASEELAEIGRQFVEEAKAAVLIVPSALAPADHNWLLNPEHPDFRKIQLLEPIPFFWDQRLVKR